MLLPPFQGHLLKSFDRNGNDITPELFTPANFMKVDADYTPKNFEDWKPSDWPQSYRSPKYENIFAVGIAFAPPHQISAPAKNPEGLNITPAPPRTGMPSAVMGKVIANNIADKIFLGAYGQRTASMAEMGAACIASIGTGFKEGSAASITMSPIVPDFEKYPETGRNLSDTFGEVGKAGHWIKKILHYMFIYKAKAKPLWWIIPE
jgi:sulfide:quinone oxidoreductase